MLLLKKRQESNMVLTLLLSLWRIFKCGHSNESYSSVLNIPLVLFIMLYKVVLIFASADEIIC